MRLAWVSFDVMGRECIEASVEAGGELAAIVTLPGPVDPNRAGQCPFDDVAERFGATLIETANVNDPATLDALRASEPDAIFVVGWSQLVHEPLIRVAPRGVYGMHPTLLPRHRGRAPIPWTILSGIAVTGVTLFEIVDPTADSGPIVGQLEVPVERDETAETLYCKLTDAHVDLIRRFLPELSAGAETRIPQDTRRASAWPKRTPADGIIDWNTRASYLYDWVRAQTRPYPGAFTYLGDEKVIVWRAQPVEVASGAPVGTIVGERPDGPVVVCGEDGLLLEEVEARRPLPLGARLG